MEVTVALQYARPMLYCGIRPRHVLGAPLGSKRTRREQLSPPVRVLLGRVVVPGKTPPPDIHPNLEKSLYRNDAVPSRSIAQPQMLEHEASIAESHTTRSQPPCPGHRGSTPGPNCRRKASRDPCVEMPDSHRADLSTHPQGGNCDKHTKQQTSKQTDKHTHTHTCTETDQCQDALVRLF